MCREARCRHPDLIDLAVVINAPHPAVFRAFVRRRPRQLGRSWYVLSFQLPGVAERADRALYRGHVEAAPTTTVGQPPPLVWGTEDAYLLRAMAEPSIDHGAEGRLELVEGATD